MAFDAYLKIQSIPGESTDENHDKWIQVLAFSHSIMQPHAGMGGGGSRGGAERAELSEFSISKNVDKSTAGLMMHCCNGLNLKKVTVHVARQIDSKLNYMEYVFETCLIRSVSVAGGGGLPTEQVGFSFRKIGLTYIPVDPDTNKEDSGGKQMFHWDLLTNKGGASV